MANDPKRPTGMTTSGSLYGDDDGEAIENAVSLGRRPGVGRPQQPVDPSVTPERTYQPHGKSLIQTAREASDLADALAAGEPYKPYPPLESYPGKGRFPRPTKEESKNMSMRTILDNMAGKVRDPDATYHDHATGEVRRMDGTGIEHDPYDQLVQQAEEEPAIDAQAVWNAFVAADAAGEIEPDPDFAEVEGVEVAPGMTYEESVKAFGVITAAAQHGGPGQGESVPFRRPVTASEMAAKMDEAAATRRAMTAEERIRREGASSQPLVFHPFERTERIVSMIETQAGRIYVATERGVYRLEGDRLVPLQFDRLPDAP